MYKLYLPSQTILKEFYIGFPDFDKNFTDLIKKNAKTSIFLAPFCSLCFICSLCFMKYIHWLNITQSFIVRMNGRISRGSTSLLVFL